MDQEELRRSQVRLDRDAQREREDARIGRAPRTWGAMMVAFAVGVILNRFGWEDWTLVLVCFLIAWGLYALTTGRMT